MNTKVNKAYFLVPVIYAVVIIFFLYMQFSGSRGFSAEVSGIEISGRTHAGAPGRSDYISDLRIGCNGLVFSFDEEAPLRVYSQDGLVHSTVPVDYRVTASGVDLRLNKGMGISFFTLQNNENVINITLSADDPESIKYIELPLSAAEGSDFSTADGIPVISVASSDGNSYFLSLPEGASFDDEASAVTFLPTENGFGGIVFEKSADSSLDAFTYWFSGNSKLVSVEELDNSIENYMDKAVSALTGSRFSSSTCTWESKTGLSEFNENALAAVISEKVGAPDYASVKSSLSRGAEKYSRNLTMLSSALFGNIVNEGWSYNRNLERKLERLTERAASSDYSVFTDAELTTVILSEDSDSLVRSLLNMTEKLESAEIGIEEASGLLRFYDELNDSGSKLAGDFSPIIGVVENIILPSIKVVADKLYLVDDDNVANIMLSVSTGMILKDLSEEQASENVRSLGREIINSALSLSDGNGFLPEIAKEDDDGKLLTDGTITPEAVYPLLTGNPYYPSEDFFFTDDEDAMSVFNQAGTFNIERTDFGYRMSFDFPTGQIHSFAVRNIEPFYQMNLLGYKWNPDHRFLNYFSGWWYDRDSKTMYVKIRHRSENEEILIYTERPAPAPYEPSPEPDGEPESSESE